MTNKTRSYPCYACVIELPPGNIELTQSIIKAYECDFSEECSAYFVLPCEKSDEKDICYYVHINIQDGGGLTTGSVSIASHACFKATATEQLTETAVQCLRSGASAWNENDDVYHRYVAHNTYPQWWPLYTKAKHPGTTRNPLTPPIQ